MIRMSLFRKLSTTQGVAAALLRVIILNLGTGVLAVILYVLYSFQNSILPIVEFFRDMCRDGEIFDIDKTLESGWVGLGGTMVLPVEFPDGFSGIVDIGNWFPHVFFFAEVFPVYLVFEFATF